MLSGGRRYKYDICCILGSCVGIQSLLIHVSIGEIAKQAGRCCVALRIRRLTPSSYYQQEGGNS